MERKIWKNGKLLPESHAIVSVYDSAMMFGDTVFEMTRSFNGEQFKLREHLERLLRSARYLRIPVEMTVDDLEHACMDVQKANLFEPDDEHRLMINVTRGILPMYSSTGSPGTTITITDFPLRWTVAGMGRLFDTGINAVTPSQRAIPAQLLEPRVKNRSRVHYLRALQQAAQMEGDNNWPVMLDMDGYITEGPGWNFFVVSGDQSSIHIGLPITSYGPDILMGISREFVFELQKGRVGEEEINEYDVIAASEAFVTATPFCLLPVTSFNGVPIGDGKSGPVYEDLLLKWGWKVNVDIKAQIQSWDNGIVEGASTYSFK